MTTEPKTPGSGGAHVGSSAIGRLLAPVVGHVSRRTAVRQAEMWNDVLHREASEGHDSGLVVVVHKDSDGLWRLRWQERPPS